MITVSPNINAAQLAQDLAVLGYLIVPNEHGHGKIVNGPEARRIQARRIDAARRALADARHSAVPVSEERHTNAGIIHIRKHTHQRHKGHPPAPPEAA